MDPLFVDQDALSTLLLEALGTAMSLAAAALVATGALRLYRARNVPGARCILGSLIGWAIGLLALIAPYALSEDGGSELYDAIIGTGIAVMTCIGAYGFARLAKFVAAGMNAPAPQEALRGPVPIETSSQ